MENFLSILNYTIVLFFGVFLSFSFTGTDKSKKDKLILCLVFSILGILQLIVYLMFSQNFLYKIYPILIHIPLILFFIYFMKKPLLQSLTAVLTAYLLCTPRKWFGTFLALLFNSSEMVSYIAQIVITIPLIYFICKYIAPFIAGLENESKKINKIFVTAPLVYYIMEYLLTVYSKIIYSDNGKVAEFFDSTMVILYCLFSIVYLHEINQRKETEMELKINIIKSEQAEKEIEQLKKYHEQAVIYRHDLLHHLNYIHSTIENNEISEAISYINEICTDIHNQKVEIYCENNTINLIMSAYIGKAQKFNIKVEADFQIPREVHIPVTDICTILANAMDNAIHACEKVEQAEKRSIYIAARMQKNNLFIKIQNPFTGTIEFIDNLPKSKEADHGIGTRSIAIIVKKYNGLYNFEAKDNVFTVTIAMNLVGGS